MPNESSHVQHVCQSLLYYTQPCCTPGLWITHLCLRSDHFRWQQHLLGLKDHQGNTALHLAVMEGIPESVQLLLQAGADPNTLGMTSVLSRFDAVSHTHAAICACHDGDLFVTSHHWLQSSGHSWAASYGKDPPQNAAKHAVTFYLA